MTEPFLIHVGYHKTGTTWLQRHLFSNADAGFHWPGKPPGSPVREFIDARLFGFDPKATRRRIEELYAPAVAQGLRPVISVERFSGSPFSGGWDSKEIAGRLAVTFPEARVLVVVREQRSMILSTYQEYVEVGGSATLEGFLDPPRRKSRHVPWFDFDYLAYDPLLRHYRSLFGPDRVFILAYEQFAEDPAGFAARIAEYAGRPLDPAVAAELPVAVRTNAAVGAAETELRRRLNRLAIRSEVNPTPFLDRRLRPTEAKIARVLLRPRKAAALEDGWRRTIEEAVGDRYAASNRATAELTGLDLRAYGWTL